MPDLRALSMRIVTILLGTGLLALPVPAQALCSGSGCYFQGIPLIRKASMHGNDLSSVSGACVVGKALVDLWVQQRSFAKPVAGVGALGQELVTTCINNCEWIRLGDARADARGRWSFEGLDQVLSTQLLSSAPATETSYGVLTNIRVRTWHHKLRRWTDFTEVPQLESMQVTWNGVEGSTAFLETRVRNARWMHATVADGPDDDGSLATTLDMDQDTPNFWLRSKPNDSTVNYSRTPNCPSLPGVDCSSWLSLQAPSIHVQSPMLGRSGEYPFVLGLVTAVQPGSMFIATTRLGERSLADLLIDVNVDVYMTVDVDIDFDIGFNFFSLF
jgi:hypothetical protein